MPLVFVISAPSGSGKSTLVQRLIKSVPDLQFSTSVTTRSPRAGEVPGESYDFASREEFLAMRGRGDLLEWAEVFGNFYGTSRQVLERAARLGRDLILDIDVQGAAQLKEKLPEAVTIFILPPSRQELEHRLRHRSSDSADVIERRLDGAGREVSNYEFYDYVLVNDDLDESFEKLRGIILAERCRTSQMAGRIQPILESFRASTTT